MVAQTWQDPELSEQPEAPNRGARQDGLLTAYTLSARPASIAPYTPVAVGRGYSGWEEVRWRPSQQRIKIALLFRPPGPRPAHAPRLCPGCVRTAQRSYRVVGRAWWEWPAALLVLLVVGLWLAWQACRGRGWA